MTFQNALAPLLLSATGMLLLTSSSAELVNGVRPSNILGGAEQHASFSFVRPGLTQTAFAFNGPSSHQAFSSSIGDPHLAQRVLPGVANALAYRNPGLGFFGNGHVTQAYAAAPASYHQQPLDYQQQQQLALAYQQQLQYQQQQQHHQQASAYSGYTQQQQQQLEAAQQAHLSQILASNRFAPHTADASVVPEQIQLQQQQVQEQQQQQQQQNLLGVAYSAAPSVAHVKVHGNGYKVDF